jgi:pyridoxal phosphate enzyme (YggS family)
MVTQALHTLRDALPSGVRLVAVSKFHPVERLMEAYNAGQRLFGENRPQELAAKAPQMPSDVEWHFIGHLQTNKLKLVLPYVTMVQSVDSFHLLEAINNWCTANSKCIDILLELHLGAEETKTGFTEEEILSIAGEAKEVYEGVPAPLTGVRIRGLMGMATNTDDMSVVEADFARIEALFNKIKALGIPGFDQLSIGMSGDWPLAVRHGATMVRIGTDIFGPREY